MEWYFQSYSKLEKNFYHLVDNHEDQSKANLLQRNTKKREDLGLYI
jgi:hypothetical protein